MSGGLEVKLHTFLTLAPDAGEQSASHSSHFTQPWERTPTPYTRIGNKTTVLTFS